MEKHLKALAAVREAIRQLKGLANSFDEDIVRHLIQAEAQINGRIADYRAAKTEAAKSAAKTDGAEKADAAQN